MKGSHTCSYGPEYRVQVLEASFHESPVLHVLMTYAVVGKLPPSGAVVGRGGAVVTVFVEPSYSTIV
jgi:hypothetical protein